MQSAENTLGFLTLGQSPRTDVIPVIMKIIGKEVAVRELGALDGLNAEEIEALYPQQGEIGIETRLGNGSAVLLAKDRAMPLVEKQAKRLAQNCRQVVMLCSGEFPLVRRQVPALLEPITLLRGVVQALASKKTLGIIGPESDLEGALLQWRPYAGKVVCSAASPYSSLDVLSRAVADAAARGAEIILMDDMGFTEEHRIHARENSSIPVICATTLTARVLSELV